MDRPTEIRLAKAPYSWLGISPILTIGTLFMIASSQVGDSICDSGNFICDYDTGTYIGFAIGILVSALWHLILLQYVNNKESEFVRSHGRRALTQAGIRTGVALIGLALDWFLGADGGFACVAIIALLIIWALNVSQSKRWVESDPDFPAEHESQPLPVEATEYLISNELVETEHTSMNETDPRKPEDILTELYQNLQSEDDVVVIQAISSLSNLNYSSEAIRRRLEWLAVNSDNKDICNKALALIDSPSNRAVQRRLIANKLERGVRYTLLQEINGWEKSSLIDKQSANVIRRRYDFDVTAAPAKQAAPQSQLETAPAQPATTTQLSLIHI